MSTPHSTSNVYSVLNQSIVLAMTSRLCWHVSMFTKHILKETTLVFIHTTFMLCMHPPPTIVLKKDFYTREVTGCQCYFDMDNFDCACCQNSGCQCSKSNLHQCVQCGMGSQCGLRKYTYHVLHYTYISTYTLITLTVLCATYMYHYRRLCTLD